jgi:hypothetical protein
MPAKRPLEERFWEKVDKCGPLGPYVDTPCWIWTAYRNTQGYGYIGVQRRRTPAHRVSWLLHRGIIADQLLVLHRCHNSSCVNPEHLYLGTHAQNMSDKVSSGRCASFPGSSHPNSRLNDRDVEGILLARSSGLTLAQIANQYIVSEATVAGICTGRTWRHIDRSSYSSIDLAPGSSRQSFSPEMRKSIIHARSLGYSYPQIAERLGISVTSAHRVCKQYEDAACTAIQRSNSSTIATRETCGTSS